MFRFKPNRTPAEQEMIEHFVRVFLKSGQREEIARILGKNTDPNSLKFDADEAQQLVTANSNRAFLMGVPEPGAQNLPFDDDSRLPILQMYDFINTIDRVLTLIKTLDSRVRSMSAPGHGALSVADLKKHILHPSFVPWVTYDAIAAKGDKNALSKFTGSMLGSQQQMWVNPQNAGPAVGPPAVDPIQVLPPEPSALPQNMTYTARQKYNYDRSCEEAYLMRFEVLQHLLALGQGLFRIQDVKAKRFSGFVAGGANAPISNDDIPQEHWINSFTDSTWPHQNAVVPLLAIKLDPANNIIHPAPNEFGPVWNLANNGAAVFGNAQSITNHKRFLMQAKDTNLAHYPLNIMGKIARMCGATPTEVHDEFKYPYAESGNIQNAVVNSVLENAPHHITGGPIAQWFFMISERRCWPSVSTIPLLYPTAAQNFSVYDLTGADDTLNDDIITTDSRITLENIAVTGNRRAPRAAFYVPMDRVHQVMSSFKEHPIWACPALAVAYRQSRVGTTLLHMYHELQKTFARALETDVVLRGTDDARMMPAIALAGSGIIPTDRCPPGMVPRYRDYSDRVIDPMDATYVVDGVTYLKSNVDPSKTECVLVARAPIAGAPIPKPESSGAGVNGNGNTQDTSSLSKSFAQMSLQPTNSSTSTSTTTTNTVLDKIKQTGGVLSVLSPSPPSQQQTTSSATATASAELVPVRRTGRVRIKVPLRADTVVRSKSAPPPSTGVKRKDRRKFKCVVKTTANGHTQRYWVKKK